MKFIPLVILVAVIAFLITKSVEAIEPGKMRIGRKGEKTWITDLGVVGTTHTIEARTEYLGESTAARWGFNVSPEGLRAVKIGYEYLISILNPSIVNLAQETATLYILQKYGLE